MTRSKPKEIGTIVDVAEGGTVVRPDGTSVTVTGGSYVLNQSGEYVVDGSTVNVGADDDAGNTQEGNS